jgi:hypothetical protein
VTVLAVAFLRFLPVEAQRSRWISRPSPQNSLRLLLCFRALRQGQRQYPIFKAGLIGAEILGVDHSDADQRSIVAVQRIFFCNKSTPALARTS